MEASTQRIADLESADIDAQRAGTEQLSQEKWDALASEAKAAQVQSMWSTIANVAQYVGSLGSIALGWACGGLPGAALMVAGGVGLGARVARDTHLLQTGVEQITQSDELQEKIIYVFEQSTFALQMGLSLAGGIGAWHAGTLAAAQASSMMSATDTAASVVSSAGRIGTKVYDKRIGDLHARRKEIDGETNIANEDTRKHISRIGHAIESDQFVVEAIVKANRSLEQELGSI